MSQVIIFTNDNGGVSVCVPTGELPIQQVLAKDCPAGAVIVNAASLPSNEFFNAWEQTDGVVTVNLTKAKNIVHDIRRAKRAAEFAPWDIKATIPSEAVAAEAARQAIRDRYAAIQNDIDSAPGVPELSLIVQSL